MTDPIRRTKIIATLGPSSREPATMRRLVEAGVDVFRVNFSHASQHEFDRYVRDVRSVSSACGKTVGVLADLQGPKLRIGELESHLDAVGVRVVQDQLAFTHQRVGGGVEFAWACRVRDLLRANGDVHAPIVLQQRPSAPLDRSDGRHAGAARGG